MRAIKRLAFRYFIPLEEDVSEANSTPPVWILPTRHAKEQYDSMFLPKQDLYKSISVQLCNYLYKSIVKLLFYIHT